MGNRRANHFSCRGMGILVAIAAIADPVQRISFRLTLPWYLLTSSALSCALKRVSTFGRCLLAVGRTAAPLFGKRQLRSRRKTSYATALRAMDVPRSICVIAALAYPDKPPSL